MNSIWQKAITFSFVLLASNGMAYEDAPFSFHADVSDSVLFVLHGVEYREIDLEYIPGDFELYLNGVPILNLAEGGISEEDCPDYLEGVDSGLADLAGGFSCFQALERYKNNKKVLMWDIGDWLDMPAQQGKSDVQLTASLLLFCGESDVSEDVTEVFVEGGKAYIRFEGVRYSSTSTRLVPSVIERELVPLINLPFREAMLSFSRQLIIDVKKEKKYSTVLAVTNGGGSMTASGNGMMSKGISQLKAIEKNGCYVEGPVPESYFR